VIILNAGIFLIHWHDQLLMTNNGVILQMHLLSEVIDLVHVIGKSDRLDYKECILVLC
jgi:hypothetical protein